MPYIGEFAALSTALCWLGSSLAFAVAGREAGAQSLNQFRLVAALPMLLAAAWLVTGDVWPTDATWARISALLASGMVGLVIGDWGYFHALATIGPRLASVIMALWPACTVGLDACGGAVPTASQAVGVGLTVAGVAMVLARRQGGSWRPDLTRRQWALGVAGALVGALGQAGGFVIARAAMAPGPDQIAGVDPLLATVVRMAAAVIGMQIIVTIKRRPLVMRRVWRGRCELRAAVLGTLCGPVLGVWMSMVAGAYASDAGVAAALMGTTPIFMLPLAIWLYGARVTVAGAVGTLLAGAGVADCFVGG
ncbi:MAG: DMT family transporter [Planctomycetota bacterium]|nr:DMT family transporter [Planctomycetota bacterium]